MFIKNYSAAINGNSFFGINNINNIYFYQQARPVKIIFNTKNRCKIYEGNVILRGNNVQPSGFELMGSSCEFSANINNGELYFDNKTQDTIILNIKAKNLTLGGGSSKTFFIPPCGSANSSYSDGEWLVCYSWEPITPGEINKPIPDENRCLLLKNINVSNVYLYEPDNVFLSTLDQIIGQKIIKDSLFYEEIIESQFKINNFAVYIYSNISTSVTDIGNEKYLISANMFVSTAANPGNHPVFGPWNVADGGIGSLVVDKKNLFDSIVDINLTQTPIGTGNSIYGLGLYDFSNSKLQLNFL